MQCLVLCLGYLCMEGVQRRRRAACRLFGTAIKICQYTMKIAPTSLILDITHFTDPRLVIK